MEILLQLTAFQGQIHTPPNLVDANQQYYYQEFGASYYGLPDYHTSYLHGGWYQNGIPNQLSRSTSTITKTLVQGSRFSPDAPEFVPRAMMKQQNTGEQDLSQPSNSKPKKKKKKKKSVVIDSEKQPLEVSSKTKGILLDSSKSELSGVLDVKPMAAVEFPNTDESRTSSFTTIKDLPVLTATKETEPKPQKSVKFQEPIKEPSTRKKDKIPKKNLVSEPIGNANKQAEWPGLQQNISAEVDSKLVAQPRMSFAEKLKNAPTKSPFLDWRDQRTTSASSQRPATSTQNTKQVVKPEGVSIDETKKETNDDGFITVTRKGKGKEKKEATIEAIPSQQGNVTETIKKSPEEIAKKKAEREKKKQREKEKKMKAREEKLLAEKLAPKGGKVTFITPAVMEKLVQNKRAVAKVAPPVFILADEFPALGITKSRGNLSESESEWETTEIEVHVDSSPILPSTTLSQRNVKRSDPIKYDLMALITKKTNLKERSKKMESEKKSKNRAGVVANVLDRCAPILSRGKIRNKKPKLSEIRKALLAAKAKRKALGNLTSRPPSQRPHKLHSKKFREYCDQMLTDRIDQLARDMLYHLRTFQDRAFKKDPIKGNEINQFC